VVFGRYQAAGDIEIWHNWQISASGLEALWPLSAMLLMSADIALVVKKSSSEEDWCNKRTERSTRRNNTAAYSTATRLAWLSGPPSSSSPSTSIPRFLWLIFTSELLQELLA
jgi:hypothetical protein